MPVSEEQIVRGSVLKLQGKVSGRRFTRAVVMQIKGDVAEVVLANQGSANRTGTKLKIAALARLSSEILPAERYCRRSDLSLEPSLSAKLDKGAMW